VCEVLAGFVRVWFVCVCVCVCVLEYLVGVLVMTAIAGSSVI